MGAHGWTVRVADTPPPRNSARAHMISLLHLLIFPQLDSPALWCPFIAFHRPNFFCFLFVFDYYYAFKNYLEILILVHYSGHLSFIGHTDQLAGRHLNIFIFSHKHIPPLCITELTYAGDLFKNVEMNFLWIIYDIIGTRQLWGNSSRRVE